MALSKRSLADIRKAVDAIHQSRLANVKRNRGDLSTIHAAQDTLRQQSHDAIPTMDDDDINFGAIAAFNGWAERKSVALDRERAAIQARTDKVVLDAIKSLGQTRAVKRLSTEIEAQEKAKAERVSERAITASLRPRK